MDLIVGMGMTGLAVAKFLKQQQLDFATYDDKKSAAEVTAELGFATKHLQKGAEPRWHAVSKLIVSPGFAVSHPVVAAALAHNIPVLSEIELAFRHTRGRVVGITGSNGKSTTTSLIHHLLVQAGFDASLCGNIGDPFIGKVTEDSSHIHVVEVSSFQLEHVRDFRPEVGLLLNLAPDHLDRHKTFEAYCAAKLCLFQAQQANDIALVGADINLHVPGKGRLHKVPGDGIVNDETGIAVTQHFRLPNEVLPQMGSHLRSNVLFASAAVAYLGLSDEAVIRGWQTFQGLEHRFETVGTRHGVLWINDSKATNVHAAQAALRTIDRPYVLILGGSDKGETFAELDFSNRAPKAIIAYGETAPQIMGDLKQFQPRHVHAFDDAVRAAHQLAAVGDAVLLSPACASFDQHQNFVARGRRFKALFQELEQAQ